MKKFFQLYFIPLFITIWSLSYLVYFIFAKQHLHIVDAIIAIVISWLIVGLWHIGVRLPHVINYFIYLYVFFAIILGSCVGLYHLIPFYDLLLHGFFGYVGATTMFFVISYHKVKMEPPLFLLFCLLATLGMAAIWEIYEFAVDSLFGLNTQIKESGVGDTMQDIIVTLGGILAFMIHFLVANKIRSDWFFRQGEAFAKWKIWQRDKKEDL